MQGRVLTNCIEIFNSLIAWGHNFSVCVRADLTSFGVIWKHASGDMRGERPNTLAGLVPKTLKNPFFFCFYYFILFRLPNFVEFDSPHIVLSQETLEALYFMNPYVFIILTVTRTNHIYRNAITYTDPLPYQHTNTYLCQYKHTKTQAHEAVHTYSHTFLSILSCWTVAHFKCQSSQC